MDRIFSNSVGRGVVATIPNIPKFLRPNILGGRGGGGGKCVWDMSLIWNFFLITLFKGHVFVVSNLWTMLRQCLDFDP